MRKCSLQLLLYFRWQSNNSKKLRRKQQPCFTRNQFYQIIQTENWFPQRTDSEKKSVQIRMDCNEIIWESKNLCGQGSLSLVAVRKNIWTWCTIVKAVKLEASNISLDEWIIQKVEQSMNKEQNFSGMVYNEERSIAADEVKNLWMAVKVFKGQEFSIACSDRCDDLVSSISRC